MDRILESIQKQQRELANLSSNLPLIQGAVSRAGSLKDATALGGHLWLTIPFDLALLEQYRQELSQIGYRQNFSFNSHVTKSKVVEFANGDKPKINISMKVDLDGSQCKAVQIGEKVVPIYQFECK